MRMQRQSCRAQKEVDEAKANAKTNEEIQAVADAQAKVDEADKIVEASKKQLNLWKRIKQ